MQLRQGRIQDSLGRGANCRGRQHTGSTPKAATARRTRICTQISKTRLYRHPSKFKFRAPLKKILDPPRATDTSSDAGTCKCNPLGPNVHNFMTFYWVQNVSHVRRPRIWPTLVEIVIPSHTTTTKQNL